MSMAISNLKPVDYISQLSFSPIQHAAKHKTEDSSLDANPFYTGPDECEEVSLNRKGT